MIIQTVIQSKVQKKTQYKVQNKNLKLLLKNLKIQKYLVIFNNIIFIKVKDK